MAITLAQRGTSLRRGLQVLAALGSDAAVLEGGLGVTQIAALTGHEKSLVSRALSALAEHGLVERPPGQTAYRLGWGCFALAARAGEPRLIDESRLALATLVDEVGEGAHLSVLQGADVLTVLTQTPSQAIVARSWVGRTLPGYCTASGRALLIDTDRDALAGIFGTQPLAARGPNSPTDVDDLARRIDRARRVGYAVADEESEPGLVAVAAPVRDFTGGVVAALNVSAPKFRLGARVHATGEVVRATAQRLSAALVAQDGRPRIPSARRAGAGASTGAATPAALAGVGSGSSAATAAAKPRGPTSRLERR